MNRYHVSRLDDIQQLTNTFEMDKEVPENRVIWRVFWRHFCAEYRVYRASPVLSSVSMSSSYHIHEAEGIVNNFNFKYLRYILMSK